MFDGLGGGGVAVAMSQDAKYIAALSTSTPQVRSCTSAHGVGSLMANCHLLYSRKIL